ncbi:MAG: group III truncated hemoglobin [Chitinophagaceae bacterium]|nr:MAG: group III truncated hemoglobin [Chitinophagaceae bacterium]
MAINRDIETREDIDLFIRHFYERVKTDPTIGIIFTEVVKMDWDHHIPVIVDFWETILLDNPVYKRNAMAVHYDINTKYPLKQQHFDAWLHLFNTVLDGLFQGPITELAKKRAAGIGALMLFKMTNATL